MPMDITELKSKKIAELNQIAKDLNLTGYSELRKQELIFKILEAQVRARGNAGRILMAEQLAQRLESAGPAGR